jgi:PAS domain S-box-containing protein
MSKIPSHGSEQTLLAKKAATTPVSTLQHLAFDNSLHANIISIPSTGEIITVNTAACNLLGYSKEELTGKNISAIFEINKSSFKKMLKQRMANGHFAGLITTITRAGNIIPCEITSAVFFDNGNEKAITTIVDVSKNMLKQSKIDTKKEKIIAHNIIQAKNKADVRLAENNKWIKFIAKTSYDVMWDWNIFTGEIYVGDSIREVFGYNVQNNTVSFRDVVLRLLPAEKDAVEKKLFKSIASASKSWTDSFSFKRNDGSIASTTCRASIVRNEGGKAVRMIGALHDVSRLQVLENKLEEQITAHEAGSQRFLLAAKLAFDVIWDWNIESNAMFIGEGFEEAFGYSIKDNQGNTEHWRKNLYPDDKDWVIKRLEDAIASSGEHLQYSYRFVRADGSVANVFDRASIFRHADGKAYRMIGVMQDVSRQTENKRLATDVTDDNKTILIKKIKNIIVDMVHYSEEQLQTNFSNHLSKKLQYDYTYLANLFSEGTGISIQKFIIEQKIERVKELINSDKISLTQIAAKLHYSSVAHLSNQFKKVTGFTPSFYLQHENNPKKI